MLSTSSRFLPFRRQKTRTAAGGSLFPTRLPNNITFCWPPKGEWGSYWETGTPGWTSAGFAMARLHENGPLRGNLLPLIQEINARL
jgi:hypothetical protein